MYLTCQVRYVPLENKFIQENNFPKGKTYYRYLEFPTEIKKTSYKNFNSNRILTKLPYDFRYPIEFLCFFRETTCLNQIPAGNTFPLKMYNFYRSF